MRERCVWPRLRARAPPSERQYLPEDARDSRPRNLGAVFLGANLTWTNVVFGAFAILFGLSFWQTVTSMVVGTALGTLAIAPPRSSVRARSGDGLPRCTRTGRSDTIPIDADQPSIQPRQFRRTLAWFIARKPRGIVAAAIQYGHVKVQMTVGYAAPTPPDFPTTSRSRSYSHG
ncbi:MAG: hypothetical protein QOD39_4852 [Mycobacterium sp.]|jgi:hypothetical protein|nr:hypothetical protein [Mycobacterium sp.]